MKIIFINKILKNKVLCLILIIGLIFRIINPTYGSPVLYVNGDEPPNYLDALYMIANKTLITNAAIYPPLGSYFQVPFLIFAGIVLLVAGKFESIDALKLFLLTNQGAFLFVPRILSGVLGTATIYLVYKIALYIFGQKKPVGLFAATLFMFSFNQVQMAHSGRPWTLALFFFNLSILFGLKSISSVNSELKYSLLSAVCVALTYGTHQVGIFAFWSLILIRILSKKHKAFWDVLNRTNIISFSTAALGMGLFYWLHFNAPKTGFFRNTTDFPLNYPWYKKIIEILIQNNLWFHLREFFIAETMITIFFMFTFFYYRKLSRVAKALIIWIFTSYYLLGFSFAQPRYMLLVLMMMSVFAGRGVIYLIEHLRQKSLKTIFATIIILVAGYIATMWNYIYVQTPTFVQAQQWIEANVAPSEVILTTSLKFTGFAPAKDVLSLQQGIQPGFYSGAGQYLAVGEYPTNVRNIIYLDKLENINYKERVPQLLKNFPIPYTYIVDLYWDPQESKMLYVDKSQFQKKVSFSPLKNKFVSTKVDNILATVTTPSLPVLLLQLERSGPYVDIYELRK